MNIHLVQRYSAPVPRYTSYPTAPNFSTSVQAEQYFTWLSDLPGNARLSLYVHIPFCRTMCWYCGCTTKAVARYEPISSYLDALTSEIANVAALLPPGHRVAHIHWGGGTPNALSAADITRLATAIRRAFNIEPNAEFAVEIDPRNLGADQVEAFIAAGVNRVSVGVQDFATDVQAAIGRHQSFEETKRAFELFRSGGVSSINVDLVYGLPHQTRRSVAETMRQVLTLKPDRIAVFGYAHLPSRIRHQRLIDESALPGVMERYAQSRRLARVLRAAGYEQIGLDHFALPADTLATQEVRRNFQGYTTDPADALIGLGASSIGHFPQGYVQNEAAIHEYKDRVAKAGFATARGIALSADDKVRAFAIERLMCDFEFSAAALKSRFGAAADAVVEEAEALVSTDRDGLVSPTPDGFRVTELGKPFVRSICACFDAYLGLGNAKHALAV